MCATTNKNLWLNRSQTEWFTKISPAIPGIALHKILAVNGGLAHVITRIRFAQKAAFHKRFFGAPGIHAGELPGHGVDSMGFLAEGLVDQGDFGLGIGQLFFGPVQSDGGLLPGQQGLFLGGQGFFLGRPLFLKLGGKPD